MSINFVGKSLVVEEDGKKILVVGDLHLGYEESLNRAGVFVSREIFKEVLSDLDEIFSKIGRVDEVVLLGDVKHEFGKIMKQEWKDVLELIDYLKENCKRIVVVKGNHDKLIEPIASKRNVEVVDYYVVGSVCFLHGDRDFVLAYDSKIKTWVIGHGHPAIWIVEKDGAKREKYKCFLDGKFKKKRVVIVPSFSGHSEGTDPRENNLGLAWNFKLNNYKVRVVAGLEVLDFGLVGKLT